MNKVTDVMFKLTIGGWIMIIVGSICRAISETGFLEKYVLPVFVVVLLFVLGYTLGFLVLELIKVVRDDNAHD